jgi:hypothetical protein
MKITEKELKDLIKEVILESHTKEQEEELEEIVGELENASKMHKSQAERIQKILDDTDDKELKEGDESKQQMTYTEKDITNLENEYINKRSIAAFQALSGLAKNGEYDMKNLKSRMRSMKNMKKKKGKEPVTENLNCGCGNDPCITFGVVSIKEARKIVREEIQADLDEAKKKKKKKTDKERMKCNSPRRIRKGEAGHGKKKFVVKACKDGKEKIIRYGDANLEIKKDSPKRRKSFRARHKCDTAKDKMSARYWSCKKW